MARWRDSSRYYAWFDEISHWVANTLGMDRKLADFSLDQLAEVETFEEVEKQLIVDLSQHVPLAHAAELARFEGHATKKLSLLESYKQQVQVAFAR